MANQLFLYFFVISAFGIQMIMLTKLKDGFPAARAEVQSCRGCALNRLYEVKQFIFDDLPKYSKVSFKPIPGATPDLVLFNTENKEIERIDLSPLTRNDCNKLMSKFGFIMDKPDVKRDSEL